MDSFEIIEITERLGPFDDLSNLAILLHPIFGLQALRRFTYVKLALPKKVAITPPEHVLIVAQNPIKSEIAPTGQSKVVNIEETPHPHSRVIFPPLPKNSEEIPHLCVKIPVDVSRHPLEKFPSLELVLLFQAVDIPLPKIDHSIVVQWKHPELAVPSEQDPRNGEKATGGKLGNLPPQYSPAPR